LGAVRWRRGWWASTWGRARDGSSSKLVSWLPNAHLRRRHKDISATSSGTALHLRAGGASFTDRGEIKLTPLNSKSEFRSDRHQFRFIVSPDDAVEIADLKPFTRQLMAQMERDLGTRLDWVAIDHWDTEHPHTHIVLRGTDEAGRDLIIAREYIARGMRQRASELATEWLGERTERDIKAALNREVTQERWTSLDREIQGFAREAVVDLRLDAHDLEGRMRRALHVGRLDHLVEMGLAKKTDPGTWRLNAEAESTLRAMGERGDIIRTMQRAFTKEQREYAVVNPSQLASSLDRWAHRIQGVSRRAL
jgi:type IV secretory pathway VirD2 relaxase